MEDQQRPSFVDALPSSALPPSPSGPTKVKVRPEIPRVRHRPPAEIDLPEGVQDVPLVAKDGPDSKKLQELWKARIKVFTLPREADAYEAVWQKITDGHAFLSRDPTSQAHIVSWRPDTGEYVALLRYVEVEYKLPEDINT